MPNLARNPLSQYLSIETVDGPPVGVDPRYRTLQIKESAGSDAVRCPHCDKKLGERLVGTLEVTCPRCKRKVTITR